MSDNDFTSKEILIELKARTNIIHDTVLRQQSTLENILDNAKETNGRIHKLEILTKGLEKEMTDRDMKLEHMMLEKEAELKGLITSYSDKAKIWTLKVVVFVTMLGSFIWIKESRDAILAIIKAFI